LGAALLAAWRKTDLLSMLPSKASIITRDSSWRNTVVTPVAEVQFPRACSEDAGRDLRRCGIQQRANQRFAPSARESILQGKNRVSVHTVFCHKPTSAQRGSDNQRQDLRLGYAVI